MGNSPFLSIVIPTRQRHETLNYTLQTILQQDFKDYEIIVSDNNSTCETRKVVECIGSKKIKYLRSDVDLSLSDSWELAISEARGEYVTIIADNDGFIDGSLRFLKNLIHLHQNPKLISLVKNTYNWPCLNSLNKNILYFYKNPSLKIIDGKQLMKHVVEDNSKFFQLPMIYNAIVHKSLIVAMKKPTGRVFNSVTPDVYSGFCLAYLSKRYLHLTQPLTIAGNSAKSLGVNYTTNHTDVIQRESKAREISKIQLHPFSPCVISHSSHIADCFWQAQKLFNIQDITLARRKVLQETLADLVAFDEETLNKSIKIILESCADDHDLLEYIKTLVAQNPPKIKKIMERKTRTGFDRDKLILDGNVLGMTNILDVSQLMSPFYDYTLGTINYIDISDNFDEIEENAKIVIWGIGKASKQLQNKILEKRKDITISYFIDSYMENLASTPKILKPESIVKDSKYLIIASMFVEDISKTVQSLAFFRQATLMKYSYDRYIG